ncbi:MAG: CPBP family intramembrane metalloprotease [Acidobacteria bacterium]|nr:CPBP family intramembrane metalloprotease [Acidobacteriota bacterium]
MNTSAWFILPDGQLRAGWRLLLFLTFLVMAAAVFNWTASALATRLHSSAAVVALSSAAFLGSVITATAISMRFLEHQPFSAIGLRGGKKSLKQAAAGAGIGMVLIAIITAAEVSLGAIHFERSGARGEEAIAFICSAAGIFFIAAASEELLFRGYALQRIVEGVNAPTAVVLTSVAFGLLHAWNPYVTRLAVTNTILAGVLLAVVYLQSRSLWMAIALHFSWNWSLAVWGLPISGVELGKMPWEAISSAAPKWVSGGDYGPEGGIIATAVLLLAICIAILRVRANTKSAPTHQCGAPDPSRTGLPH